MGWGDPIGLSICPFAQWDLEVRVHGVADIPIWGPFVGFSISLDGRLEPLDFVLKGECGEAMGFFAILDSLDQTGCDLSEGFRVDIGVGGEYIFHSTRGVAGSGRVGMASRGFGGCIDGVVGHGRGGVVTDVDERVVFIVNCDRCKGILGKSMDVQERGCEWCGCVVQGKRCGICGL